MLLLDSSGGRENRVLKEETDVVVCTQAWYNKQQFKCKLKVLTHITCTGHEALDSHLIIHYFSFFSISFFLFFQINDTIKCRK